MTVQAKPSVSRASYHIPIGTHLLVEFYGCRSCEFSKQSLQSVVLLAGCNPVKYVEHEFKPQGKSAVWLLEESHVSVHTYPEFGYIAIDIFTCGPTAEPYKAIGPLKELFKHNTCLSMT